MAVKIKLNIWELLLSIIVTTIIPVILITMYFNKKNQYKPKEVILAVDMIGKTAEKETLQLTDLEGAIFYLPKGFKLSEEISEPKVSNGIVIVDDTGDKQTNGSEFVWIPVKNETYEVFKESFVSINSYLYGRLDSDFDKYKNGSEETEEYKKIQESIFKYGGFYIARYEAGVSEKMLKKLSELEYIENDMIVKDTTEKFGKGKYKPVSKKDTFIWNNISWGGTFKEKATDGLAGNDSRNGAVKVSRSMYNKNSKTTVKSNLCYGKQWDAVMNFIDPDYYESKCTPDSIIVNSSEVGNYNDILGLTGSYNEIDTKNIYNLAGNVFEWTMEGYEKKYRVVRGGSYETSPEEASISTRKEQYPNSCYRDLGFRVALYIEK